MEMGNVSKRQQSDQRVNKKQQPKASNGSSTQRVNLAHGGELQLAPKQKCVLVQYKSTSY